MLNWFRKKREVDVVAELDQWLRANRQGWHVIGVHDQMIKLRPGSDTEVAISLDRVRQMVRDNARDRAERDAIYAQFAQLVSQATGGPDLESIERDGHRLRPRIVPPEYYQTMKRGNSPVARALPELSLWIVYAIDSPQSVSFLLESHLARLGADQDQVHEIAMHNLHSESFRKVVRDLLREKNAVNFRAGDSYDAARLLLLPECLEAGEQLAACIPDRDTLFICPVPRGDDWTGLAEIAKIPASDRLILDRPILVTRRGFELK